jgi:hypothetical protein
VAKAAILHLTKEVVEKAPRKPYSAFIELQLEEIITNGSDLMHKRQYIGGSPLFCRLTGVLLNPPPPGHMRKASSTIQATTTKNTQREKKVRESNRAAPTS